MTWSFWCMFGLFLGATFVRSAYEWGLERGRVSKSNRPLFVAVAFAMFILWSCWFGMCGIDPYRVELPEALRRTGLGIVIVGLILAVGALIQLRGVVNIDHLVTHGFFTKLRHPMYVGFILWIMGWALYHGATVSLFAGLVCIGNILYWRQTEEVALAKVYSDDYRHYREKTWF